MFEDEVYLTTVFSSDTNFVVNNAAIYYDPKHWLSPNVIAPKRWLVSGPLDVDLAQDMAIFTTHEY